LSQFPNTLEAFDGIYSRLVAILPCFPITLEGKTVEVEFKVIDANLTYNLLLGRSWIYAMCVVALSLFRVLFFPHQGKIVMVDQLSFTSSSSYGNVLFVEHTSIPYESVGAGVFKYPALMGNFSLPPPSVASINMISTHFDPWVIRPFDQVDSWGEVMPLSPAELNYVEIISASISSSESTPLSRSLDAYVQSPWLGDIGSPDLLQETFPSDEAILETMSFDDAHWFNHHHRSSLLSSHGTMTICLEMFASCIPS